MKAVVVRSYGSPGQLRITDVDTPVPAADEVLVRVRATSVNPYDWHHACGEPYVARLMPGSLGLRGPKIGILGCDMAGQVEAVGADVTGLRPGDDVYALLSGSRGWDPGSARVTTASALPAHLIVHGKPGPGVPQLLTALRCKITLQRKTPYNVRHRVGRSGPGGGEEDEGFCPAFVRLTRPRGPHHRGHARARVW